VREHLPPDAQAYFLRDRHWCVEQAARIGPACAELIDRLLADRIVERLRPAQGVIDLTERFPPERVEAACRRALEHDSPHYRTVETLLLHRPEWLTAPGAVHGTEPYIGQARFARPAQALFHAAASTAVLELFAAPQLHRSTDTSPIPEFAPQLKQLRLSGILDSLDARNRQAFDGKLAYTEFLSLLIQARWTTDGSDARVSDGQERPSACACAKKLAQVLREERAKESRTGRLRAPMPPCRGTRRSAPNPAWCCGTRK
jgi:hypothetical protein